MYFPLSVCILGLSLVSNGQEMFSENSKIGNWQATGDMQVEKKSGEMLEALLDREEDKCYGKKCDHSEECCKGAACVDIEGVSGTCLPIHGKEFYQACEKDSDCGAGLSCTDSGNFPPSKTCQLELGSIVKKGFRESCETSMDCHNDKGFCCVSPGRLFFFVSNSCLSFMDSKECLGPLSPDAKPADDECVTSSDCDTDGGLCCQVLRRHRMAPKKVCHYFLDPKSCVGQFHTNLKELKYIANPFFKARLG